MSVAAAKHDQSKDEGLEYRISMGDHVTYGREQCRAAADSGAVAQLLLSDTAGPATTAALEAAVVAQGGEVTRTGSVAVAQFCGCVALLRFEVELWETQTGDGGGDDGTAGTYAETPVLGASVPPRDPQNNQPAASAPAAPASVASAPAPSAESLLPAVAGAGAAAAATDETESMEAIYPAGSGGNVAFLWSGHTSYIAAAYEGRGVCVSVTAGAGEQVSCVAVESWAGSNGQALAQSAAAAAQVVCANLAGEPVLFALAMLLHEAVETAATEAPRAPNASLSAKL